MKRNILVACIISGILCVCMVSSFRIAAINAEFTARLEAITAFAGEQRRNELLAETANFSAFWQEKSHVLMHFVRHSPIDEISRSVPRLRTFAEHEKYADFLAELGSISWQMGHIVESERISWDNFM